jgi:hypothetical protein
MLLLSSLCLCNHENTKNTVLLNVLSRGNIDNLFHNRWVDIGTSTWVPLECIQFYVEVPKTAKKSFFFRELLRKGHAFWGQALYKGPTFSP